MVSCLISLTMTQGHDQSVHRSVSESSANSQITQVVYLQEAPRHNNQGRPLDTVLRAALVAVETNHDEIHLVTFFCMI